jgi:hypothetical protein
MMKRPDMFDPLDPANLQSAENLHATVGNLEGVLALAVMLQGDLTEIRREHEALKRICYLLVNTVQDEALREEMHSTYMLLAMRSDNPVKEGFEDMPGDDTKD